MIDLATEPSTNIWLMRIAACLVAILILWRVQPKMRKVFYTVLLIASYSAIASFLPAAQTKREAEFNTAKALFSDRCKSAGEKIHSKVENVEGVFLSNIRSKSASVAPLTDRLWPDAGLPHESGQNGYIISFLWWESNESSRSENGYLTAKTTPLPGYKFVEAKGDDNSIRRYSLDDGDSTKLVHQVVSVPVARYAVEFTNFDDPVARSYWIAGTKVTIRDIHNAGIVAEKTWYAMDPGQGSTQGGRIPWAFAVQCPEYIGWNGAPTRFFVQKVLNPKGR